MAMRVLYLIDTLETGGTEKSLREILSCFRETESVLCHVYPGETLKRACEDAGIRVISLNIPGKYSFCRAIRAVRNVIREVRPDLIHTALFRSDIIGRFSGKMSGVPLIGSFVNDSYALERKKFLTQQERLKLMCVHMLDAATVPLVTHFTANSMAVKRSNCDALRVSPERVDVINRGRDSAAFTGMGGKETSALRTSLGLGDADRVLLNSGRLVIQKGQDTLVKAMPLVLKACPKAKLLIAGEGPYRPELERLIRESGLAGSVRLLGRRDDIPGLLAIAEGFVFSSLFEGMPGALIEAMLAGKPVIASDIPVHAELVRNNETGLLFPLRDHEALAQHAIRLLQDPVRAAEMGARARELGRENFDIQRIAAQHEELYREVLGRR